MVNSMSAKPAKRQRHEDLEGELREGTVIDTATTTSEAVQGDLRIRNMITFGYSRLCFSLQD